MRREAEEVLPVNKGVVVEKVEDLPRGNLGGTVTLYRFCLFDGKATRN